MGLEAMRLRSSTSVHGAEEAIQLKVPADVKRQLAVAAAERGETIRSVVLRALKQFGLEIQEDEIHDRRKTR